MTDNRGLPLSSIMGEDRRSGDAIELCGYGFLQLLLVIYPEKERGNEKEAADAADGQGQAADGKAAEEKGQVMNQTIQRVVDELRQTLPPVFAGTSLNELTGDAIHWPTIQNKRAAREIPDECFCRSGKRVLVLRDPFLTWWGTTLSEARQPAADVAPGYLRMAR